MFYAQIKASQYTFVRGTLAAIASSDSFVKNAQVTEFSS